MQPVNAQKLFVTAFCLAVVVVGFLIKLPSAFRQYDKQLHASFYLLTAAMLNSVFAKKNFLIHLLIFSFLFCMGIAIEYAQEYSNRFFAQRIHGRFDPEDVKWNLIGLIAFSAIWASIIWIRMLCASSLPPRTIYVEAPTQEIKPIKHCPHCGEKL